MKRNRLKIFIFIITAILRSRFYKKGTPLFVSWAITNRCNSRCKYCKVWANNIGELTTEQCFLLIAEIKKLGVQRLNFTGGEPLLREDMPSIIEYCYRNNISSTMNTNGILLPKRIGKLKHLSEVKLSLDGPRDIHDYIRGPGSFNSTIKAIEAAKSRRINVVLETVLSNHNLDCTDYIINIAEKFNVIVGFQPATLNRLGSSENNNLSPAVKEYREVIKKLIERKNTKSGRYIYNSKTGLKHLYWWPDKNHKLSCGGGFIFCRIEPNGDLVLCARNTVQRFNSMILGFERAFSRLKPCSCGSCWCTGVVEANYLLSFNSDVILNLMRVEEAK